MWTLIIQSANDNRREFTFGSEKVTIGRGSDNTVVLKDLHASRRHAEIFFEDGNSAAPAIRDLNSTNGTFVNGEAVSETRPLAETDQIRIGTYVFTLVAGATGELPSHLLLRADQTIDNRLLFESIEQYAVLVYDLEKALATAADLDTALDQTNDFISMATSASACYILLKENFARYEELGLPVSLQPLEGNSGSPRLISEKALLAPEFRSLIVVPVRVHSFLEALIYVVRDRNASRDFDIRDLQLAIAAGHQLALVIQQKRHEQIIIRNINHDPLTQLPNRNLLRENIQEAINLRKKAPDFNFALLFLDLDDFKLVNDSLGHPVGDDLLVVLAKRFRSLIKPGDTIARFGGDEFAILCLDYGSEEELIELGQEILRAIAVPFNLNDTDIHVAGSLGITIAALDYRSANEMIRDADIAMYRAKEKGENGFEIYDETMREVILERISLNNELRSAIQNDEFQLHYQPILSLADLRIVGFEALIRWQSPHRGFMKPGNFLVQTTTTGLLRAIDDWVLETACLEAATWEPLSAGGEPLFISVNLSNKQIGRIDLVETIDGILGQTGLPADRLWLEITEKTVFGNEILAIQSLMDLKTLGVHFSLDDFGTGYSTFNYLYRLPIDVLKIDRTFVSELDKAAGSEKIIRVLIELGKNLGLSVVAEGIETRAQYEALREHGCDFGQGYYFARPLTRQGAVSLLEAGGIITP